MPASRPSQRKSPRDAHFEGRQKDRRQRVRRASGVTFDESTGAVGGTASVGWYDFSDITKLFQDSAMTTPVSADEDPIGAIVDKSPAGDNLVQATAGARPIYDTGILNSKSVARFATSDLLKTTGFTVMTASTAFLIGRWTSAGNQGWASFGATLNQGYQFRSATGTDATRLSCYDGSQHLKLAGTQALNGWALMHWAHGGGLFSTYLNGVAGEAEAANDQSTSTASFRIGTLEDDSTWPLVGQVAEVIVYASRLSAAQQNAVGTYLANKWGLSWTTVT